MTYYDDDNDYAEFHPPIALKSNVSSSVEYQSSSLFHRALSTAGEESSRYERAPDCVGVVPCGKQARRGQDVTQAL
ncbi:hypothetical protein RR46_08420 [Papilio xuthus]|uniref:Uncharacterized protein n=1 Tax=Papilio xuthus TaxID=66420 RepID=A0A194PH09_PAPXU|nr:hypothetical protein RR46_08420 [Papilio xuthus]